MKDSAQVAKMDYVCRKVQLQPGESVVEAGCGWGALALHMAREHGVTVICSTHDHKMLDISDRIVWMRDGNIEKVADRRDVHIQIDTMTEH